MRQDNNNSMATSTAVRFGAVGLKDIWWNVHSITLPTISMDIAKYNSRPGARSGIAADTCEYGDLSVDLTLDRDWKTYNEVYTYFLEGLNVENGKFSHDKKFELWIEFLDGKGNVKQKFWFHSCRLLDFGGVVATPNDDEDNHQVLTLNFSILYFDDESIVDKM